MNIKPCQAFARGADIYAKNAKLQQAVAWRLAKYCQNLIIPEGLTWDFGAGSGHLAAALEKQKKSISAILVDECRELLAKSEVANIRKLEWDLNQGVPPEAIGAALIASSFALHWLKDPVGQIKQWGKAIAPGGWLAITVPIQGSFKSWQSASELAGVKCTGITLPIGAELIKSLRQVAEIKEQKILRYSKQYKSGLEFLKEMKWMGVNGGATGKLNQRELRKLNNYWLEGPGRDGAIKAEHNKTNRITINWDIMLIIAQKPKENS
jgi:malonyl-CoA O-methyltransferase